MSRRTKNIIMVVLALLLCASMAFTVSYAGKNLASQAPSGQMQMGGPGTQNSKDSKSGSSGDQNASGSDSQNSQNDQNSKGNSGAPGGQPPQMPDGQGSDSAQGQPPQMPDGQSGDSAQGQPPQMPDGQSGSGQSGDNQSGDNQNGNNQNGDNQGSDSAQGQPPQMPDGQGDSQSGSNRNGAPRHHGPSLDGMWYALFGAEALAFALILFYLILSGMNRKTLRETFGHRDKVIIFLLAAVLAGGLLTQTEAAATRYLPHSQLSQGQQMQLPGGPGSNGGPGSSDSNSSPDSNGGPNGSGGPGQENENSVEATGATTVDGKEETLTDTYTSTKADENAILVTGGGSLTADGATINKKSGDSSNTGSSDFSGVNAGLLVNDNSTAAVKNATITTSAKGANAVFATGEKSKVTISDSTIKTTGEASSRGLDATYGGTIEASNVKITTRGGSCAAMATDRGEGTVSATKSTMETNGAGSPIIYSTGNISLTDSTGTAKGAQIAVVEGKNSATIKNSKVSCSAAGNRGDVDIAGVMVYQSMSGDAGEGTGNFTAEDSDLSISKSSDYYKTAPMFFVTNTSAVIDLTDTKLDFGSGVLLSAKATDEWGQEGSNGGTVTLKAAEQTLAGDIQLDKLSSLTMDLSSGSTYTGTINKENSAKSIALKLDKTSKIKLTGDSYVTSLEDADADYSNIDFNGHTLYVNGKAVN